MAFSQSRSSEDPVPGIIKYIKSKVSRIPDVGIVCGSGLSGLAATLSNPTTIHYEELKGFPQATVAGHVGELVFGTLGPQFVVCMKGRFHYYEGYTPAQVGLPIRVMCALGIKVLVVTNASGGANQKYSVGDVMIIKDQICTPGLAGNHPLVGRNDERFGVRFPAVSPVFDTALQDAVMVSAKKVNFKPRIHKGVYFGVSGPSYETPHEIGLIRTLGGDAVGMSTVFEILTACHCGIKLLGLSLITNRCMGPDDDVKPPTHEEVLAATRASEQAIQALVADTVSSMKLDDYKRSRAYDYFSDEKNLVSSSSSAGPGHGHGEHKHGESSVAGTGECHGHSGCGSRCESECDKGHCKGRRGRKFLFGMAAGFTVGLGFATAFMLVRGIAKAACGDKCHDVKKPA